MTNPFYEDFFIIKFICLALLFFGLIPSFIPLQLFFRLSQERGFSALYLLHFSSRSQTRDIKTVENCLNPTYRCSLLAMALCQVNLQSPRNNKKTVNRDGRYRCIVFRLLDTRDELRTPFSIHIWLPQYSLADFHHCTCN